MKNQMMAGPNAGKFQRSGVAGYQKTNGYQLKVGGVVVGSWANGSRNALASKMNRPGMVRLIKTRALTGILIWFIFCQVRYPINQKAPNRVAPNRYRGPGAPGTLTTGFNQKTPQRFIAKPKKQKPIKKDTKKTTKDGEDEEEEDVEKKTILKDGVEKEDEKPENR